MDLKNFKEAAIKLNEWTEISGYVTEDNIGELMSEEGDNKYLVIDGVPTLAQTVILYLEDGTHYAKLDCIMKNGDDGYINAAHIDSIKPFDRNGYIEIKMGLEFIEKCVKSNLKLMYNEEFEKQIDITMLFEPKMLKE